MKTIILFFYFMNENLEQKGNSLKQEIIDFLKDLIIIIAIVFIIRNFIILPFQISGHSMESSYYDKEFIIVDIFSYLTYKKPQRWDVIVFNSHIDWKEYFIKRIIWLPWETLKIEWGNVFIKKQNEKEFKKLNEPYLDKININSTFVRWSEEKNIFEIPENSYFVMWDNRTWSTDSRSCFSFCNGKNSHFVKKEDIIWKVFIDLWYFDFEYFSFFHPELWIKTTPRFFNSPSSHIYDE